MPPSGLDDAYVDRLVARLLEPRLGHVLSPWPRAVRFLIDTLAAEAKTDASALLRTLLADPRDPRIGSILAAATIPHTSFFRHPEHFDRMRSRLRELQARRQAPVRVWSAGCATGQEAYSVALIAEEVGVEVDILATDISAAAIARAKAGAFERGPSGGQPWQASDSLRSKIDFAIASLVAPNPTVGKGPFDLILCRNVLIYFQPAMVLQVQNILASHLKAEGDLIFSPVESVLRVPEDFAREDPLGWFHRRPHHRARRRQRERATRASDLVRGPAAQPLEPAQPTAIPPSLERAAQSLQAGDPDLAEATLHEILALAPRMPEGWFLLGEALVARGERRQASVAFRRAAQHASESTGVIEGSTLANAALRRARELDGPGGT